MPSSSSRAPLYEIKADLFKALAHPVRVHILELLVAADDPCPVSDLLETLGIEASLLSQHLGVLRHHHVVVSRRVGNTVTYEVAQPQVADLLWVARSFVVGRLATQRDQLASAVAAESSR